MATPRTIISASLLALGVLGATASAWAFDGQQFTKEAKVSLEQARAVALRHIPGGAIAAQELEREPGGSGLRYSFDIKTSKAVHEVGVDAKTGTVLENSVEGANAD